MPCIALLSDFGLVDATASIAKGILMQHTPDLPITDISHEVQPYNTGQAAYLLASAYKNFPAGTCHVLLFNIFSETTHNLILSEYKGWYFLSSDNGLLPLALGLEPEAWLCLELKATDTFNDWLHEAGRIIRLLQTQRPEEIGLQPYHLKETSNNYMPVLDANYLKCEVIHVDNYENVVINFTRPQLASLGKGRPFRLQFTETEEITNISTNYNDVRPGYKLCRFNSNDYLEICINRGKAASLLGLRLGGKHNDIKIFFE